MKRFNADRYWRGVSFKKCRRIRAFRTSDALRADGLGERERGDRKVTRLPD